MSEPCWSLALPRYELGDSEEVTASWPQFLHLQNGNCGTSNMALLWGLRAPCRSGHPASPLQTSIGPHHLPVKEGFLFPFNR